MKYSMSRPNYGVLWVIELNRVTSSRPILLIKELQLALISQVNFTEIQLTNGTKNLWNLGMSLILSQDLAHTTTTDGGHSMLEALTVIVVIRCHFWLATVECFSPVGRKCTRSLETLMTDLMARKWLHLLTVMVHLVRFTDREKNMVALPTSYPWPLFQQLWLFPASFIEELSPEFSLKYWLGL